MDRSIKIVLAVLLMVGLLAGCGPKDSSSSSGSAPSSSAAGGNVSDDGDAPTSAAENGADAAQIDQSCPASNTKSFAKTKFALHAGLAFGAFHRYLYKPYKNGSFTKGTKGRVTAFIKGGLAALFVKREVRLASEDVKANPTLCKTIAAPLASVGNQAKAALDKLKGGDPSGLESVNSSISEIEGSAGSQGASIKEDENADIASAPR